MSPHIYCTLHRNLHANKVYLKKAELFHEVRRDEGNSRLRNFTNDPKKLLISVYEKIKFFFYTDFLLKGQITYRYTWIACPDVSFRDSKRVKYIIPIHTNIITLKAKRLQYRLYCHTYICIRCTELVKKGESVPLQARGAQRVPGN